MYIAPLSHRRSLSPPATPSAGVGGGPRAPQGGLVRQSAAPVRPQCGLGRRWGGQSVLLGDIALTSDKVRMYVHP